MNFNNLELLQIKESLYLYRRHLKTEAVEEEKEGFEFHIHSLDNLISIVDIEINNRHSKRRGAVRKSG